MHDELCVERALVPEIGNGGFPTPPTAGPVRVIAARHAACGEAVRVLLPEAVPARAVRRLHCASCAQDFETSLIEELGIEEAGAEQIVIRSAAEQRAEMSGGSFALPEFNMPAFGSLALPDAPVIEPEPVVEPEPIVVAPTPVEPEPIVAIEIPPPPPLEEAIEGELLQLIEEPNVVDAQPVPVPAAPAPRPVTKRRSVSLPQVKLPQLPQIKRPNLSAVKLPQVSAIKLPKLPELKRPAIAGQTATLPKLPRLSELKLPAWVKVDPGSTRWRIASAALAIVAVLTVLNLVQGDDTVAPQLAVATDSGKATTGDLPSADELRAANADSNEIHGSTIPTGNDGPGGPAGSKDTKLVRGSTYSLALPKGWQRTIPEGNAAFAAQSADGGADAQLWISEDPTLDFPEFIKLSLKQLESLAGSARIVERIPGPTPEDTVVRLAAETPDGLPTYEVTLRSAGPYRYYLATSVQPDATPEAADGADLIVGSFTPEAQ
jgi:hypothetical protein